MSQSSDSSTSITDKLTDDMGRPIPELVLPFAAIGVVGLLVWWWRFAARAKE